jgi:hypothetical protein
MLAQPHAPSGERSSPDSDDSGGAPASGISLPPPPRPFRSERVFLADRCAWRAAPSQSPGGRCTSGAEYRGSGAQPRRSPAAGRVQPVKSVSRDRRITSVVSRSVVPRGRARAHTDQICCDCADPGRSLGAELGLHVTWLAEQRLHQVTLTTTSPRSPSASRHVPDEHPQPRHPLRPMHPSPTVRAMPRG